MRIHSITPRHLLSNSEWIRRVYTCPGEVPHTIYILRDNSGSALYVGCSRNHISRVASHKRKSWGAEIASVETEEYAGYREARLREMQLFDQLKPRYGVRR